MKLPRQIRMGDRTYKVRRFRNMKGCFAEVDHVKHDLKIQVPQKELRNTVLHEIIHIIEAYFNIELTEDQVCSLANGLRMVCLDNPSLINMFKKGKGE